MRVSSPLLMALAQTVGSQVGPRDGEIELPLTSVPVITPPLPHAQIPAFSVSTPQQESFDQHILRTQAASTAAFSQVMCTFFRGLWELELALDILATFTETLGGGANTRISLRNPAGFERILLVVHAVNLVPQLRTRSLRIMFRETGWDLQHTAQLTGVGQTLDTYGLVHARKLL